MSNTKQQGDCIFWVGAYTIKGYGITQYNNQRYLVTRLTLYYATGNNGDGLMACHTCDNPQCINPEHLFWATQKDNLLDMIAKGRNAGNNKNTHKTHCQYGHQLVGDNLYPNKRNHRECYECCKRRSREKYHRDKLKNNPSQQQIIL